MDAAPPIAAATKVARSQASSPTICFSLDKVMASSPILESLSNAAAVDFCSIACNSYAIAPDSLECVDLCLENLDFSLERGNLTHGLHPRGGHKTQPRH